MSTTIIDRLLAAGDALVGKVYRALAGYGSGGFSPDPSNRPLGQGEGTAAPLNTDSVGNLAIRGQVLTDEGSLYNDFSGASLDTALTGTVTFTNGSPIVTGVGTAFISEACSQHYARRTADSESDWVKIARVVSDTELELDGDYAGTSGTGGLVTYFPTSTGAGGSIAVASSNVTLASGTTSGSTTLLNRSVDYQPILMACHFSISQRIANQEVVIGFVDDPTLATPNKEASVHFDGTNASVVKLRTRSSSAAADMQEQTLTLPGAAVTSAETHLSLEITSDGVTVLFEGQVIGKSAEHLPGPYDVMEFVAQIKNTGVPASSTNLVMGELRLLNVDNVSISKPFAGEALGIQSLEEVDTFTGVLTTTATTADQVVLSFTVPSDKYAFVSGYTLNVNNAGPDANPIKIGRNTVTTEPTSPGSSFTKGATNIFRAFRQITDTTISENFGIQPRWVGNPGDVVKVTVTPSGAASTIWRASLDIVFRS